MAHVTCSVVEREAVIDHIIGPHPKTVKNQAGHAKVPEERVRRIVRSRVRGAELGEGRAQPHPP